MPELTKVQTGFLESQGPFKLSPGTAGAPGLHFEGDASTGFYRSAEDEIALSVNGSQKLKFTEEGLNFNGTSLDGTPFVGKIDKSVSDNAVDVFVYDTSKDSDGGAWRKRTRHTSWYNETLNTATRGSRRDFPSVAIIVATADNVIIYDGDDPSLPMWMVFLSDTGASAFNTHFLGRSSTHPSFTPSIKSVWMLNGLLVVGKTGISNFAESLTEIKFINEFVTHTNQTSTVLFNNSNIVSRNGSAGGYTTLSLTKVTVNFAINDLAMTVLPNAPIDPGTGLATPTIAIATNGGVTVIKDDGKVWDIVTSPTSIVGQVAFDRNKILYAADNTTRSNWIYQFDIPTGDTSPSYLVDPNSIITNYSHNVDFSTYSAIPLDFENFTENSISKISVSNNNVFVGTNKKLSQVYFNSDYNPRTALMNQITRSYNTGWQPWNIKGVFLSDTSTATINGSELVTNGTFTTNTTGWIANGSGSHSFSVVNNALSVVRGGSGLGAGEPYQNITLTAGVTYTISYQIISGDMTVTLYDGTIGGSTTFTRSSNTNTVNSGWYNDTFTVSTTGTKQLLFIPNNANTTAVIDNVSIRLAERDRSINNESLAVFGTLTKNVVATGSNLVAYSGFSASNYLQQPYNSALNFNTGNFSFLAWIYPTGTSMGGIISRGSNEVYGPYALNYNNSSITFVCSRDWNESTDAGTWGTLINGVGSVPLNTWSFIAATFSENTARVYINGVLIATQTNAVNPKAPTSNYIPTMIGVERTPSNGSIGRPFPGSLSLVRASASAPSAEQIAKIYNDEKILFQPNSQCTLYGSSDAVTALAYDDKTNLLHVGTSSGRSDFLGLERINNTTTAVTTAISAYDGSIAQQ